jgi:hypothetical protein
MPALHIIVDGTDPTQVGRAIGKYAGRMPPDIHLLNDGDFSVVGMPEGTSEGKTSVMVILDDGKRFAIGETTLRLFLAAADALRARYGDELEG